MYKAVFNKVWIYRKRIMAALLAALFAAGCAGCRTDSRSGGAGGATAGASGGGATAGGAAGSSSGETETGAGIATIDPDGLFSSRDAEAGYEASSAVSILLSDSGIQCESDNVKAEGSLVTVSGEGTYLISGTLSNGGIIVSAGKSDKLQLVLCNVDICREGSAAIYVEQADKVFLTLAEGSDNTLANKGGYGTEGNGNIDAVIFSKEDLTLNGTGTLTVSAEEGHGIVSKDDLVFYGGTYRIQCGSHGISGKDSIRIAAGNFTVAAGKDGFHAENAEEESLGYLYVADGDFEIQSDGDGLSAGTVLQIDGGTFRITAGGGSENGPEHTEGFFGHGFGGGSGSQETQTDTVSRKGMKAGTSLTVKGGSFTIDSADDAVHTNGSLAVSGGTFLIQTGDDGFHADGHAGISGGTVTVTDCYEGLEGTTVTVSGGEITLAARDDGINAAGGNDGSGFGGGFGGDFGGGFGGGRPGEGEGGDEDLSGSASQIQITGGVIRVNAEGDGVDSNGALLVSGGETYISGPVSSANAALDYGSTAEITGGLFVAVGAVGMAQQFSSGTQGSIMLSASGAAGTEIVLQDASGKVLLSYTAEKQFSSVILSCPEIKEGGTYQVQIGSGSVSVSMTSLFYTEGGMGGPGMGRPGMGGGGFGGPGGHGGR